MLTEKIESFYFYEQKMKNAIKKNDTAEFEKIRYEAGANIVVTSANTEITRNVLNTYFSEDLFHLLTCGKYNIDGIKEIDKEFIENNKKYVEGELDVSLSNVEILFLNGDFKTAEAWCMSCKADEHYVVLPTDLENNFLSDDLLIHELGHTAEFCIRRSNIREDRLINHRILSEAIAHYSQFKYLSNQNIGDRVSAVGSILQIAPLLEIVKYCLNNRIKEWSIDEVIKSTNFDIFRNIYSYESIFNMIKPYTGSDINYLYHSVIEPRLGAILALSLLDNKDAIKSLCLADTGKSVKNILDDLGLDSDKLLDFSKADEILKRFIFQS